MTTYVHDSLEQLKQSGMPVVQGNEIHKQLYENKSDITRDDINFVLYEKGFESQQISDAIYKEACKRLDNEDADSAIDLLKVSYDFTEKFTGYDAKRYANIYLSLIHI